MGKTSLIRRLTQNNFNYDRVPTTSMEEVTRHIATVKMLKGTSFTNKEPIMGASAGPYQQKDTFRKS